MTNRMKNAHQLSKGDQYALIPRKVATSDAYLSLTASALKLLTLALCNFNGRNNGDIALTQSNLRKHGFTSADTLNRSIKQLLENGLLVLTRQGGFAGGGKNPNLYAFSWLNIPQTTKLEITTPAKASDAWKSYVKKRSSARTVPASSDACVLVAPIRAALERNRADVTERNSSDPPDTFLRSYPEGPPPSVGEGRGSSVR